MEPIVEERSELAMDIAQAVVEKLDIDRKLDEKLRELMLQGDRVFREIQVRQEQSIEALSRSVAICLETQRAFHEEHQRLLTVVKGLAAMVAPYSPYGLQAVEAHARAAALAEETEVLKQQIEVANTALNTVAASVAANAPPSPQHMPTHSAAGQFSITLRKADDTSLGLSVTTNEESKVLIVERIVPGGAVESWNRQCCGDATAERVVIVGDRIICVNGIENDVDKMLEACSTQRLVKLTVARGPGGTRARTTAAEHAHSRQAAGKQPNEVREQAEQQVALKNAAHAMRTKAPEFVPIGVDAAPLQQTQPLAAPPGLFLRHQEASAGFKPRSELSDVKGGGALDAAMLGGVGQSVAEQDGESDKEN
jgi:hypothetical protein